jgi:dihydroorotate dehydrogenase
MRRSGTAVLYRLLRPLLFRLPPEPAHALTVLALRWARLPPFRDALHRAFAPRAAAPVQAFGLSFPNGVGLAAGFDKDGLAVLGLAALGFGHLEIGTVTPRRQAGNARPRLFRLVEDRSVINRLGFPGRGAEFVARRLATAKRPRGVVLGVNLGKQRETPVERAAEDYSELIERFAPLADYLTINVSSPNTPGLRALEQGPGLGPLLAGLAPTRREMERQLGRSTPLLVKLSPDLSESELQATLEALESAGVDGVIATNTTLARDRLRSPRAGESGGLSGAALRERSTALVREIVRRTEGRLAVVACGGVIDPGDARAKVEAGACLVQLYTGMVYEGPGLVRRAIEELASIN